MVGLIIEVTVPHGEPLVRMPLQEIEVIAPVEVRVLRQDIVQIQELHVRMGLLPTEVAEPIEVEMLPEVHQDIALAEALEAIKVELLQEAHIIGRVAHQEAHVVLVPEAEAHVVLALEAEALEVQEVIEVQEAEAHEALEALEVQEVVVLLADALLVDVVAEAEE